MKSLLKKIIPPALRRWLFTLLNRGWCAVCRRLPLKNVAFFYTIRADGKLLDNSRAVYEALDVKKVIFAHKLPHSVKLKPLIYYRLLTSKVIVTDDYVRYFRAVKLRDEQKVIQLWHACGAFKKFGLDAPSALTAEQEKLTHSQYDAVAVTAVACKKFYAGAFGIAEEVCLPIGLPRTDLIIGKKQELCSELFGQRPELKGKKIYLYCPTFREKDGKLCRFDPEIDWDKLSEALEADEIFIIRRHPHMNYDLVDKGYCNIIDLSEESTLKLTAAAAVLVTDYSSVIYDACLLDTPCVFYCPDYKEYERGFYLRFPDDLPGETVTAAQDLLMAIRRTQLNPPAEKIRKFTEQQLSACDGTSARRAAKIITDWLKA